MRLFSTLILTLLVVVVAQPACAGTAYTVGASGADFTTIAFALAGTAPGDTLLLMPESHVAVGNAAASALHHNMTVRAQHPAQKAATIIYNGATSTSMVYADSTCTVEGVTFRTLGGAFNTSGKTSVYVAASGVATIENCDFRACVGNAGSPCAIVATGGSLTWNHALAESCRMLSTGGSVFGSVMTATTPGALTIQNSQFIFNKGKFAVCATSVAGTPGAMTYDNCAFTRNRSSAAGAAIYHFNAVSGTMAIDHCTFDDNESPAAAANGQIYTLDIAGTVNLTNCVITGSDTTYAVSSGGGFDNIDHCNFYGTGNDAFFGGNSTTGDTISVDPGYYSTGSGRWDFRPSHASVVTDAVGGYMGWLDPSATRWYLDADALPNMADGTSTYPFNTLNCVAGLSPFDTLTVAAGTYDESTTSTLTARGVVLTGAGATTILNADTTLCATNPPILLTLNAPMATLSGFAMTAADSLNQDTIHAALLYIDDAADSATVSNVTISGLTRKSGFENKHGLAITVDGPIGVTLESLTVHDISDTLEGDAGIITTSAAGFDANLCTDLTVDGCVFYDISGGVPFAMRDSEGTCYFRNNLVQNVTVANYGFSYALFHMCGADPLTPEYRFSHNTFADCTVPVANMSLLAGIDAGPTIYLYHNVFSGAFDKVYDNYVSANIPDVDSLAHCDAWGMPFAEADNILAATDTLHVDPEYSCTSVSTSCYRANAPGVANCADDSYMGWLRGALRSRGRPIALTFGRGRSRGGRR